MEEAYELGLFFKQRYVNTLYPGFINANYTRNQVMYSHILWSMRLRQRAIWRRIVVAAPPSPSVCCTRVYECKTIDCEFVNCRLNVLFVFLPLDLHIKYGHWSYAGYCVLYAGRVIPTVVVVTPVGSERAWRGARATVAANRSAQSRVRRRPCK